MTIQFEKLKQAYAVIDGIPEKNFDLDAWYTETDSKPGKKIKPTCGTIACAAGWLAIHPEFMSKDYRSEATENRYWSAGVIRSRSNAWVGGIDYVERTFGLTWEDADALFCPAGDSRYESDLTIDQLDKMSHKTVWQRRIKKFLKEHGQL